MNSHELDQRIRNLIEKGASAPRGETFRRLALELFAHQFETILIYRTFCEKRGISPQAVRSYEEIPSFPASGFKYHRVSSFAEDETAATFFTSGTTSEKHGTHAFDTLQLYDLASAVSFRGLTGFSPAGHRLLSLIPSPLETPRSSLAHMVETLRRKFFPGEAGTPERAFDFASSCAQSGIPLFIATTTVALSDWLEELRQRGMKWRLPEGSALFETGGRKGRRSVPDPAALAERAFDLLGIDPSLYFGEYGMTELSSPSWGKLLNGALVYRSPSWCPVRVIDPRSEDEVPVGSEGMVSLFDLANRGSVSSLITGDWARRHEEGFEILGRAVESELRGCSLQVLATSPRFRSERFDPTEIRQAKERVQGSKIVPIERTLEALSALTKIWVDPSSKERHRFDATVDRFFSPGSVREGMNRTFQALSLEKLLKVAAEEVRGLDVRISAGNLPVTGVFGFYAGLLSGRPTLHRPSSRSGGLLQELQKTLERIDLEVAAPSAIVTTPSENDEATRELFQEATDIFAQGDDETLEHLLTLAPAEARFFPYRSRFSFAVLGGFEEVDDSGLDALVRDIFIWEQQGCLSPQILFVPRSGEKEFQRFAERLIRIAEERARSWSRTPSSRCAGQNLWHRLTSEVRGDDTVFMKSPQLTLALIPEVRPEWFSTPGLLQIVSGETPEKAASALASFRENLGSAAFSPDVRDSLFAEQLLSLLPMERAVRFGELQSPVFGWPQDGHDRFRYVSRPLRVPRA